MLIDSYPVEDVFARVPEVAAQTDPVLKTLDTLLEDDQLYQAVRTDLGTRSQHTLVHGRHSTSVEVILRLLLMKHLYSWSYEETCKRVADSLVLRWFCRVYFQTVPTKATLSRWAHTLRPETLHQLNDRVVQLAVQARVTEGRKRRLDATCVQTEIHPPTDSGLLGDSDLLHAGKRYESLAFGFVRGTTILTGWTTRDASTDAGTSLPSSTTLSPKASGATLRRMFPDPLQSALSTRPPEARYQGL